uniref:Leprecan-like alpha-helical domain-containing protein n=2 Tax=Clytia hemisphaerica TaxID=252671 RepID=A0A7M5XK60_9CNID
SCNFLLFLEPNGKNKLNFSKNIIILIQIYTRITMKNLVICLVFKVYLITIVFSEHIENYDDKPAYDELYQSGRTSYDNDNHLEAVSFFEKAIADYRHEQEVKGQCWLRCQDSIKDTQSVYSTLIDGQLNFLHYVIKTRSCFQLCKEKFLGRRGRIAKYVKELFENKEPYSFLQYSLYKIGEVSKALAAAYTHFEANPSNELMKENIEILMSKQNKDWADLTSLEEPPHIALYKKGEKAYTDSDFKQCISTFEESLTLFYKELAKCNAVCEEQDTKKEVSYTASLFKHFQGILACRKKCQVALTKVDGESSRTHFVPQYFHYLQYCYFQENNLIEATNAAESYLLMIPSDPVMSKNLYWYQNQPAVKGKAVGPRPRAKKYMKQFAIELNLAQIFDEMCLFPL